MIDSRWPCFLLRPDSGPSSTADFSNLQRLCLVLCYIGSLIIAMGLRYLTLPTLAARYGWQEDIIGEEAIERCGPNYWCRAARSIPGALFLPVEANNRLYRTRNTLLLRVGPCARPVLSFHRPIIGRCYLWGQQWTASGMHMRH